MITVISYSRSYNLIFVRLAAVLIEHCRIDIVRNLLLESHFDIITNNFLGLFFYFNYISFNSVICMIKYYKAYLNDVA